MVCVVKFKLTLRPGSCHTITILLICYAVLYLVQHNLVWTSWEGGGGVGGVLADTVFYVGNTSVLFWHISTVIPATRKGQLICETMTYVQKFTYTQTPIRTHTQNMCKTSIYYVCKYEFGKCVGCNKWIRGKQKQNYGVSTQLRCFPIEDLSMFLGVHPPPLSILIHMHRDGNRDWGTILYSTTNKTGIKITFYVFFYSSFIKTLLFLWPEEEGEHHVIKCISNI